MWAFLTRRLLGVQLWWTLGYAPSLDRRFRLLVRWSQLVCLFVCLSCSCIVLKWQKISTQFLLHTTVSCLSQMAFKFSLYLSTQITRHSWFKTYFSRHLSTKSYNELTTHNFSSVKHAVNSVKNDWLVTWSRPWIKIITTPTLSTFKSRLGKHDFSSYSLQFTV